MGTEETNETEEEVSSSEVGCLCERTGHSP